MSLAGLSWAAKTSCRPIPSCISLVITRGWHTWVVHQGLDLALLFRSESGLMVGQVRAMAVAHAPIRLGAPASAPTQVPCCHTCHHHYRLLLNSSWGFVAAKKSHASTGRSCAKYHPFSHSRQPWEYCCWSWLKLHFLGYAGEHTCAWQAFSRRLFRFLRRSLTLWPEQQPLTPVVHLWLAVLAPWCSPDSANQPQAPPAQRHAPPRTPLARYFARGPPLAQCALPQPAPLDHNTALRQPQPAFCSHDDWPPRWLEATDCPVKPGGPLSTANLILAKCWLHARIVFIMGGIVLEVALPVLCVDGM